MPQRNWIDEVRAWASSHPQRGRVIDDSRETIYGERKVEVTCNDCGCRLEPFDEKMWKEVSEAFGEDSLICSTCAGYDEVEGES